MARTHSSTRRALGLSLLAAAVLGCVGVADAQTPRPKQQPRSGNVFRISPQAQQTSAAPKAAPAPAKAVPQAQAAAQAQAKPFVMLTNTELPGINAPLAAIGVQPYIVVYQGVDPQAVSTGLVDPNKIIDEIKRLWGDDPSGYVMLNYENPFDEIFKVGPSHPKYKATVESMVGALKAVKAKFPKVKLTYYGVPRLPYWVPGYYGWADSPKSAADGVLAHYKATYAPLMAELDWLSPSVYDRYELNRRPQNEHAILTSRELSWRTTYITMCKEMLAAAGRPDTPVIPVCLFVFPHGGDATVEGAITDEEFLRDQVKPCLDAGADGFAHWCAYQTHVIIAGKTELTNGITVADQRKMRDLARDLFLAGKEPSEWTSEQAKASLQAAFGNRLAGYFNVIKKAAPAQSAAQSAGQNKGQAAPAPAVQPKSAQAPAASQPARNTVLPRRANSNTQIYRSNRR